MRGLIHITSSLLAGRHGRMEKKEQPYNQKISKLKNKITKCKKKSV